MKHISKIQWLIISVLAVYSNKCFSYTYEKDTTYTVYQTYNKLKKKYPHIKIVNPVISNKITANEDIAYKTINADRALHLDIYSPEKKGKYPALIMIHGGGWRSGNKSMERPMAQRIAENGFVAIPIEYRLSLEAKFPAAIQDIKTAIRFIKDNAGRYNIDTTKIAVEGESAGGHLALMVSMTNNFPQFEDDLYASKSTSTVHAAIDVDGISSFLLPGSLSLDKKSDSPDAFWIGGTFPEKPLLWKDASPLFYVNKNSVPVLYICSTQPRFHAGRDELIDMYNQLGIYHESYTIPDSPHSFWLFEPWFNTTENYILNYLKKLF